MNIEALREAVLLLPTGLMLTMGLTVLPLVAGFALSLPLALVRTAKGSVGSSIALAYTYVFRGTPLLVQLFLIYYGIGQLSMIRTSLLWPIFREPLWCAFIAFTLNSTAHTTEIFRGGLLAVPKGPIEAAHALGLTRMQTLCLVTYPLMIRIAFPAYTNEVIGMLKASSVASTITILEVTGLSRQLVSATFAPYEVFVVAGALYLATTLAITWLARGLERGLNPIASATRQTAKTPNHQRKGTA